MNYKFFPHTQDDVKQMLGKCGLKSLDELYNDIPGELQFKRDYDLPRAMSEIEVRNFFADLAMDNTALKCFMGAGVYDHYTPAVVQDIVNRSEFLSNFWGLS